MAIFHAFDAQSRKKVIALGEIQAGTAAAAMFIARNRWPHVPLARLTVREQKPTQDTTQDSTQDST